MGAVWCSELQCVVLQCGAVYLQCGIVCCNVLPCVKVTERVEMYFSASQFVKVLERVLQCVAVCCSVLQCVAVCCSV